MGIISKLKNLFRKKEVNDLEIVDKSNDNEDEESKAVDVEESKVPDSNENKASHKTFDTDKEDEIKDIIIDNTAEKEVEITEENKQVKEEANLDETEEIQEDYKASDKLEDSKDSKEKDKISDKKINDSKSDDNKDPKNTTKNKVAKKTEKKDNKIIEEKEVNEVQNSEVKSETEKLDSNFYIKKFDNVKAYDFSKTLDESFIKKLKITREVDYEKYIKCSGTTARPDSFVSLKLKTTSSNPKTNEILEITAIKFENNEPVEIFSTYIKPKKKITEKITETCGITNEMVKDAPKIEEVLPKFLDFASDLVLISHDTTIDIISILEKLYKYEYKKPKNEVIDTLKISKQKIREFDSEKERDKKLKSYELEELDNKFGLNLLHKNSLDYCKICAFIYMKIKNESGNICYVK